MKNSNLAAKSSNPEKFLRVIELLQEQAVTKGIDFTPVKSFLTDPKWKKRSDWDYPIYTLTIGRRTGAYLPHWFYVGFSPRPIDIVYSPGVFNKPKLGGRLEDPINSNHLFLIEHHAEAESWGGFKIFTDIYKVIDLNFEKNLEDFAKFWTYDGTANILR